MTIPGATETEPKKTPLYATHVSLGARIVDFAGWLMPIQYAGAIQEHNAVREKCGLFDVSHMGQVYITGPEAQRALEYLSTNDATSLKSGQAQYSLMLNDTGGVVDDLLVYKYNAEKFLLVINASNIQKDFGWITKTIARFGGARAANVSDDFAMLALQGPKSTDTLRGLVPADLLVLEYYHFAETMLGGDIPCILSRTGYTGEDGFELMIPAANAESAWRKIIEAGTPFGIEAIGLAARDTLRLEMGYRLYGSDMDDTSNPFDAGVGWVVKPAVKDFAGKGPAVAGKEAGTGRKLVGIVIEGKPIPRHGFPIVTPDGARNIGVVTSGGYSPTLKIPVAMGYVERDFAPVGTSLAVEVRGKPVPGKVVPLPFHKGAVARKKS